MKRTLYRKSPGAMYKNSEFHMTLVSKINVVHMKYRILKTGCMVFCWWQVWD